MVDIDVDIDVDIRTNDLSDSPGASCSGSSSCLYVGHVRHRRFSPVENSFTYSGAWLYLDLDELDTVFAARWFWSTTRSAIARFRREDHLAFPDDVITGSLDQSNWAEASERSFGKLPERSGNSLAPLADSVRDLVEVSGTRRPVGPIRLLTQPRYFGFAMNPVSFYFCYDLRGEQVETVVAEVNNTPWGQRHCYILSPENLATRPDRATRDALPGSAADSAQFSQTDELQGITREDSARRLRFRHGKRFHVSPFMDMNMEYRWRMTAPGDSLTVRIENWQDASQLFDCTLHLKRKHINGTELARVLLRYPFMTGKIAAGIYWQAFRLWWKRCPFVPHPGIADTLGSDDELIQSRAGRPSSSASRTSTTETVSS